MKVSRPQPRARGIVTEDDGTMREETDAEFRAHLLACMADPEKRRWVTGPAGQPHSYAELEILGTPSDQTTEE